MKKEDIKKYLDYLLSNGDLLDNILKKEGLKIKNYSITRGFTLFFSRLLYAGVLIGDKIKSLVTPINNVKLAQDKIREYIGVDVDVNVFLREYATSVKEIFGGKEKFIVLNFQDEHEALEYVSNLAKVISFMRSFDINYVILNGDTIKRLFGKELEGTSYSELLNHYKKDSIKQNAFAEDFKALFLSLKEVQVLYDEIEGFNLNRLFISELGDLIEDEVVKDGINTFLDTGNYLNLLEVLKMRLELHLNEDMGYRDRAGRRVYLNIKLNQEYLGVIEQDEDGNILTSDIRLLYDYLEVKDFSELLQKINLVDDNTEVQRLALLYMYLLDKKEVYISKDDSKTSFYDMMYLWYQNKEKSKIRNLYPKKKVNILNALSVFYGVIINWVLIAMLVFSGVGIDTLFYFSHYRINLTNKIGKAIVSVYEKPWNFEKRIAQDLIETVRDFLSFLGTNNFISGKIGDSNERREKTIGIVQSYYTDYELPTYYATGYAKDRHYSLGNLEYELEQPKVEFDKFGIVNELFEVRYKTTRKALMAMIDGNELNLKQYLTPVGSGYVIARIKIQDEDHNSNFVYIGAERARELGGNISDYEIDKLKKMQSPEISFIYGENAILKDPFTKVMQNDMDLFDPGIKKVILEGLELPQEASLKDVYEKIKDKYYSKTPFKDAGINLKKIFMSEEDYFEAMAGMDFSICNTAASLMAESSEDLTYVVGYYTDDNKITTKEAHAWTMDKLGNVIDATPSKELEEEVANIIGMVFNFAMDNKIPIIVMAALTSKIIYMLFGRKMVVNINLRKIEKRIESKKGQVAYARVKEVLYGGINVPRDISIEEFLEEVRKEFGSFSREELEDILNKLRDLKDERGIRTVKDIKYILKNDEVLKRTLEKKKRRPW